MFYAGIYISLNDRPSEAVIFEKMLHSAQKRYAIKDIRKWPSGTPIELIIKDVSDILADDRFLRKKKVFSQSKRPPKNTYSPPTLIVSDSEGSSTVIDHFRRERIPVDGIIYHNDDKWIRKEGAILRYGSDFYVNSDDIGAAFCKAFEKERIIYHDDSVFSPELKSELEHGLQNHERNPDTIKALSLAVWHCERVKQIKRY